MHWLMTEAVCESCLKPDPRQDISSERCKRRGKDHRKERMHSDCNQGLLSGVAIAVKMRYGLEMVTNR
jgi:hypothetical protein